MSPTAQPRALKLLIALVCALAAILMGVTSPSAAAVPTSATVDICVYTVHHQSASITDTVTERGPPGHDPSGTTDDAVDHGSHGTSARSATATPPAITTYDRTATPVQIARTPGTTDRIAQAADGNFVVFEASCVAAKTVPGYGVGATPKRIPGPWTISDLKQGAFGRPPRSLGRPDLHHADQMPGSGIHEVPPGMHRGNTSLHPNRYNQGVTDEMRMQDRQLHWWYRSQEMGGWDTLGPSYYYDNWP